MPTGTTPAYPTHVIAQRLRSELAPRTKSYAGDEAGAVATGGAAVQASGSPGSGEAPAGASVDDAVDPIATPSVSEDAAVFLSAVLEHVTHTLLSHAAEQTNASSPGASTDLGNNQKQMKLIHPRDIRSSLALFQSTQEKRANRVLETEDGPAKDTANYESTSENDHSTQAEKESLENASSGLQQTSSYLFPPHVVHKRLDETMDGRVVGESASVYLSAVLQHLTSTVLQQATGASRKDKPDTMHTRIDPEHINGILSSNAELNNLAKTLRKRARKVRAASSASSSLSSSASSPSSSSSSYSSFSSFMEEHSKSIVGEAQSIAKLRESPISWLGALSCFGLPGSGASALALSLTKGLEHSKFMAMPQSKHLAQLSRKSPIQFCCAFQVSRLHACLASERILCERLRFLRLKQYLEANPSADATENETFASILTKSAVACFADATFDFSRGCMSRSQFTAYRKVYEELYPPVSPAERLSRGRSPHNISIFVDVEPTECLENIASNITDVGVGVGHERKLDPSSLLSDVTFKELQARQGTLFEAVITRIATHRDVMVIDNYHAAEPYWVYRRIEEICLGNASLPSVGLLRGLNDKDDHNDKKVRPWLLPCNSVVYRSPLEVALAFEDLMRGAWDEDWFDSAGNLRKVDSDSEKVCQNVQEHDRGESQEHAKDARPRRRCAPVYVHAGFWSPAWRTNQVMRVLCRHISRGQSLIFYTPVQRAGKPDPFDKNALVMWLASLQGSSGQPGSRSNGNEAQLKRPLQRGEGFDSDDCSKKQKTCG